LDAEHGATKAARNRSPVFASIDRSATGGQSMTVSSAGGLSEPNIKFAIEEYKICAAAASHYQNLYATLERQTIAGMIVAYGVLLGLLSKQSAIIPIPLWWGITVILGVAAVRCFAHYMQVQRNSEYMKIIERHLYGRGLELSGMQTFSYRHFLGPIAFWMVNWASWIALLGMSAFVSLAKTFAWKVGF
jgi:hypothetical protein